MSRETRKTAPPVRFASGCQRSKQSRQYDSREKLALKTGASQRRNHPASTISSNRIGQSEFLRLPSYRKSAPPIRFARSGTNRAGRAVSSDAHLATSRILRFPPSACGLQTHMGFPPICLRFCTRTVLAGGPLDPLGKGVTSCQENNPSFPIIVSGVGGKVLAGPDNKAPHACARARALCFLTPESVWTLIRCQQRRFCGKVCDCKRGAPPM